MSIFEIALGVALSGFLIVLVFGLLTGRIPWRASGCCCPADPSMIAGCQPQQWIHLQARTTIVRRRVVHAVTPTGRRHQPETGRPNFLSHSFTAPTPHLRLQPGCCSTETSSVKGG